MYERFFNLMTKPFELVPNPDFLFLSRSHKRAITYLEYGIRERVGFILLTGEVGSGKTTILRNLIKNLNTNHTLAIIFNTRVSSEQLIAMINEDFGLDVSGKDKVTLLRELNDFLIDQYAQTKQPVLIIDEAQNLSIEVLEEIRMLSNLETERAKLLQIVLVGQPELRETLSQPGLRQLRQRISISCHINPLTAEETHEYIYHRLAVAGNRSAVSFQEGVIDEIHRFSRGIPRLINIICEFLLLSAFAEERREITLEMVKEVMGELEMENRYWGSDTVSAPQDGVTRRIETIEKTILESEKQQKEMLSRVFNAERMINTLLNRSHTDSLRINDRIRELERDLNLIKKKINTLRDQVLEIKQNSDRKGILRRIF